MLRQMMRDRAVAVAPRTCVQLAGLWALCVAMSNLQLHEAGGWYEYGVARSPSRQACIAHLGTVLDVTATSKMSTPAGCGDVAGEPADEVLRRRVDDVGDLGGVGARD